MGPVGVFFSGLNVGSIISSILGFFVAIFNNIKKYWRFYLPVLFVSLQVLTAYGWYHDHYALKAEKAELQTEVNNVKAAQAAANAKAEAEKTQLKQESETKANAADQNYSSLLAKYKSSLLRYETTQGASKQSNSGSTSSSSESGNGPSSSTVIPEVITIPSSDAQICAINTARLQAVHDWAVALGQGKDQ